MMQHLKKSRQGGREVLSSSTAPDGLDADRTLFASAVRPVEKGNARRAVARRVEAEERSQMTKSRPRSM
jgi:hypothetical protein